MTIPGLPPEIFAQVLSYLPVPALMRCSCVSLLFRDMVYEESRWIGKLRQMGAWDDNQARKKSHRVRDSGHVSNQETNHSLVGEKKTLKEDSKVLFSADNETEKYVIKNQSQDLLLLSPQKSKYSESHVHANSDAAAQHRSQLWSSRLVALDQVNSIRGNAMYEFAKVYIAINPVLENLLQAENASSSMTFTQLSSPEDQAKMLSILQAFSCALSLDSTQVGSIEAILKLFESAALREFEIGYDNRDESLMFKYFSVLETLSLDSGRRCIQLFITRHPLFHAAPPNPFDCFDTLLRNTEGTMTAAQAYEEGINLAPFVTVVQRLTVELISQRDLVYRIFVKQEQRTWVELLRAVFEGIMKGYIEKLIDYAQQQENTRTYLVSVTGSFRQLLHLLIVVSVKEPEPKKKIGSSLHIETLNSREHSALLRLVYDDHISDYLADEISYFTTLAASDVTGWDDSLQEESSRMERELLSGVSRETAKKNFLQSFTKIMLMPVNAIPFPKVGVNNTGAKTGISASASRGLGQSSVPSTAKPEGNMADLMDMSLGPTEGEKLKPGELVNHGPHIDSLENEFKDIVLDDENGTAVLPTTELAARAAIMNSNLSRIKRLLSLEVALQLIHRAKESIDRARMFIVLEGRSGEESRERCEQIFGILLDKLGKGHIAKGFETALSHLNEFNPRHNPASRSILDPRSLSELEESKNRKTQEVQPLVDFLELVHVSDLISQMIEVLYNQELLAGSEPIVDKNDFLSPSVKEKKKFEQMVDSLVATGLSRGIDVLIEQIDYILVTTQKPTDYKPWILLGRDDHLDLRETDTARNVVDTLRTHTELLKGSTDKSILDVFFQEVGVRFFGALCKHLKRQTITVEGGLKLISDLNYYNAFIGTLQQTVLTPYFVALKELGNIFIIDGRDGKAVGQLVSDLARFGGVLRPEDVYEFTQRRADWLKVKKDVDKIIYGGKMDDCSIM